MLGGDVNVIPGRLFNNTGFASDLYYATVGGTWNASNNDIFGEYRFDNQILINDDTDYGYDFFLGRASVENASETQIFVDKVIAYEKYSDLENSNYVNNYLCLGGFLSKNDCGVFYDGYYEDHKHIANTFMPQYMNKWFVFDNHDCQFNPSNPYQYPYGYHLPVFRTFFCNTL